MRIQLCCEYTTGVKVGGQRAGIHIQGTRLADHATAILMACFLPLPTTEGTAAVMSWGTRGACMGLGYQPATHRGSKKRQHPGMVWKPPALTCDSAETCCDLHCRDCSKG